MKVIGYCRVSSEDQAREGVSLAMQADKIRAYCALNDLALVEIIEDAGLSAKSITGRPGFQRALSMVFSGEVDGLVVWKLDRAFRSTTDALSTAEKLNKKGRALISINERLDTSSAVGEFFFSLLASLAQMERKLVGERTKAALLSKKGRGERVGQLPLGYALADDGVHLQEDAAEQAIISRIRTLKADGLSCRRIAETLNGEGGTTKEGKAWTHVQVSRLIKLAA
jgi:site-specific DNA recombinase